MNDKNKVSLWDSSVKKKTDKQALRNVVVLHVQPEGNRNSPSF